MALITKLEQAGGTYSHQRLADALDLYGRIRSRMADLYAKRYERRVSLSAADFLYVVQAGFITPPERYFTMLEELLQTLPDDFNPRKGIPVLVSGSLVEEPLMLQILEESGGMVVADDLCTGLRNFVPAYGKGNDPLEQLIDRTMNRFPCPSRASAEERLPRLLHLLHSAKARAVVFIFQKFCTPHLSDHPFLHAALAERRIPDIAVEIEESGIVEGQIRTRFEGFFEMLEA
jgi:benzoyl-CoA reductase/2-hydroxyglutaryl-CoA dehydratase subunit BcrC/BadD/HgdB